VLDVETVAQSRCRTVSRSPTEGAADEVQGRDRAAGGIFRVSCVV
jgi:hypothetical protein